MSLERVWNPPAHGSLVVVVRVTYNVCGPYAVTLLIGKTIFESYMARLCGWECTPKKASVTMNIGLCVQNKRHYSIFNHQQNRESLHEEYSKRKTIFIFWTSYNLNCTSNPILKPEMTICVIFASASHWMRQLPIRSHSHNWTLDLKLPCHGRIHVIFEVLEFAF